MQSGLAGRAAAATTSTSASTSTSKKQPFSANAGVQQRTQGPEQQCQSQSSSGTNTEQPFNRPPLSSTASINTMELATSHTHMYAPAPHQPQHHPQQERVAYHHSTSGGQAPTAMMAMDQEGSSPFLYSRNNGHHYNLPQHQVNNNANSTNNSNNNRPQMSPTFYSRSSPIAIIHNPENPDQAAKLRWQHPMYDTSDDEMDDDEFFQSGVSVQTLTSPTEAPPRVSGPQSLPTSLLRAPKLESQPAQDYRLHHLATLPPPMCLNGSMDVTSSTLKNDHSNNISGSPPRDTNSSTAVISQTYVGKPKYFSSYGSLRESHLTGRFGGTGHNQPEVQHDPDNHNTTVRFEPPPTLIPPRNPPTNLTLIPPRNPPPDLVLPPTAAAADNMQTEDSPAQAATTLPGGGDNSQNSSPAAAKPLSIRDRMMQKAQQQQKEKEESNEQEDGASNNKAASSLSAMLEASEQDYQANDQSRAFQDDLMGSASTAKSAEQSAMERQPALHRSSLGPGILPEGIAQAVAISYSSNLHLFASSHQQQHQTQEPDDRSSSAMLSSSMTGLELLRAASKSKPPERPTSLSILRDATQGSILQRPPPAAAPSDGTQMESFQLISRTMSEPNARTGPPTPSPTTMASPDNTEPPRGMVHLSNGRALIPPSKTTGLSAAIQQHDEAVQRQQQQQPHAQQHSFTQQQQRPQALVGTYSFSTWGTPMAPAPITSTFGSGHNPPYGTHSTGTGHKEPNPETQGAFDMDLE